MAIGHLGHLGWMQGVYEHVVPMSREKTTEYEPVPTPPRGTEEGTALALEENRFSAIVV